MRFYQSVALFCAGALAACSTPALNRGTSVSLKAAPDTAICDIQQDGALVATGVSATSTFRVPEQDHPLAISCAAPGFETLTTEIVAAAFQKSRRESSTAPEIRVSLKPVSADAATQVDCSVAGLSLKMSARDCQNMAGAEVVRYYEVPLVQAASLEWSGIMPPNWRATGKPLSLIDTAR